MSKIRAKLEKRLRNELYRDKYQQEKLETDKDAKKGGGLYANWCRNQEHPPSCNCAYV